MQITKLGVEFPPTNELNNAGIDFAAKEGHGSACTEASGRDIIGSVVEMRKRRDGNFEEGGDVGTGDGSPFVPVTEVAERCVLGGAGLTVI